MSYHGVIRPRWRELPLRRARAVAAGNEHLPAVVGHLQLVQVKCREIIHKVAFHLATKDVNFRAQNIQGVAVSAGGPRPGR